MLGARFGFALYSGKPIREALVPSATSVTVGDSISEVLKTVFSRPDETFFDDVVLVDESGFVFTLSNFEKATEVDYPGAFHIGFIQESREQVDAMHARLKADGFDVKTPKVFHGAWTFYFRAPGGFLVEVLHQAM